MGALPPAMSAPVNKPTYTLSVGKYSWEQLDSYLSQAWFGDSCSGGPGSDQAKISFPPDFKFVFAGVSYSSARMLQGGRLQFGDDTGALRGGPLAIVDGSNRPSNPPLALPEGEPSSPPPSNPPGCASLPAARILDAAWTLLGRGRMAYGVNGTNGGVNGKNYRMVFLWEDMTFKYGIDQFGHPYDGRATFEIILYADGRIAYQYKDLQGSAPGSPTPSWPGLFTTGVQVGIADYATTTAATEPKNGMRIDISPISNLRFRHQPSASIGSTCSPLIYTVTAQDGSGEPLPGYAGTIKLSVLSGGSFSLASGKGVFTPASGGSPATYAFSPADLGVAKFAYAATSPEQVSVAFADISAPSESVGDPASLADNVFLLEPADPLGLDLVAGRPHAFSATLYSRDAQGACGIATGYSASALDMWHTPSPAHPAGAAAPSVSTSPSCSPATLLPASTPALSKTSNNVSIPVSKGVGIFYLCSADVGQYSISLRDDASPFLSSAGVPSISGSTALLTARPFALLVDSAASSPAAKPSPGGTASSGSAFIPAGAPFSVRASARKWAPGQDAAKPGFPDAGASLSGNAILPSFAAPTSLSLASFTPAAGVPGSLSGGSLPASAYAAGSASALLAYSEVGSAQIQASSPAYLGSPFDVPGAPSAPIGRFTPASIAMDSSSLAPACPAGGFSYMGQPFALEATLSARSASGSLLLNYDKAAGYAFLMAPAWRAVDAADGVDLSARSNAASVAPSWSKGSWAYALPSAVFSRASSGPDGSYESLAFGLSGSDPDGVAISSPDASCGPSCSMRRAGLPTKIRHGRLEASNVFGAIVPTLKVPLRAMYWARGAQGPLGWTPNTLDSCTSIPHGALAAGSSSAAVASASPPSGPGSITLALGKAEIPVTRAPGAAASGSTLLGINLGPGPGLVGGGCYGSASAFPSFAAGAGLAFLKSDFCGAPGHAGNPSAKIIWGAPSAKSGSIVFSREAY